MSQNQTQEKPNETRALVHVSKLKTEAITLPATGQAAEVVMKELAISERLTYKLAGGQVGMLSSGWDFVGGERGVSFFAPEILENNDERVVVKVECKYFNRIGQEVRDSEVYEIDCARLLQLSRLQWGPDEWEDVLDNNGKLVWENNRPKRRKRTSRELEEEVRRLQSEGYLKDEPIYDANDNLTGFRRKLPPGVEKMLWENFQTLKRNKLPKAITCAHRRLIQRAIGTKTLDAKNLVLHFPAVSAAFTREDAERSVREVFGEEDVDHVAEMQGRQPITVDQEADVIEGEVVEQGTPDGQSPDTQRVAAGGQVANPAPKPDPEPDPEPAPAAPKSGEHKASNVSWRHVVAAAQNYHGKRYSDEQLLKDLTAFNDEAAKHGMPLPCGLNEKGAPSLGKCTPEQWAELVGIYQERIQAEAA